MPREMDHVWLTRDHLSLVNSFAERCEAKVLQLYMEPTTHDIMVRCGTECIVLVHHKGEETKAELNEAIDEAQELMRE